MWNSSICGKLSHVARSPSGLRPIEKMSPYIASSRHDILKRQPRLEKPIRACLPSLEIVCDIFGSALRLNPNTSPWKFKLGPEEKFLSSPARESREAARYPKNFSARQFEKNRETARTEQTTYCRRFKWQMEAESFNPNPSARLEQDR